MNQQPENGFTSMATTVGPVWIMIAIAAIFWIYSLVDVIRSDFTNPRKKTMWLLLLIFLAPLGTILYLMIGRSQKSQQNS
jgi:ABC-type multidrug transport system permease subunit